LATSEVALALILLVGAGCVGRSDRWLAGLLGRRLGSLQSLRRRNGRKRPPLRLAAVFDHESEQDETLARIGEARAGFELDVQLLGRVR
jgi:hypothetical protein